MPPRSTWRRWPSSARRSRTRTQGAGHRHLDGHRRRSAWPSARPSAACSPSRSAGGASSSSTSSWAWWPSCWCGPSSSESSDPATRDLDLRGQLLFIVGVGALTYALIEAPHDGWLSPLIIGLFVAAVVHRRPVRRRRAARRRPDDGRPGVPRPGLHRRRRSRSSPCCSPSTACCSSSPSTSRTSRATAPSGPGCIMLALTAPMIILAPIAGGLAARFGSAAPHAPRRHPA